jgi:Na+-driven multidrug efflux pump
MGWGLGCSIGVQDKGNCLPGIETQSIQKPTISSILSLIRSGLITIPLLLVCVPLIGLPGVQIAQPTADVIAGLISIPFIWHFVKKHPNE